jgi:hypothetical protein
VSNKFFTRTSDSNFSLHESYDIALESFENSHRICFIAARTVTPFDHAATNYNRRIMRWSSKFTRLVTTLAWNEGRRTSCHQRIYWRIRPKQRPEVPFVSILDRLDKHPEKAQQLSFIDSLLLSGDVYRDDLKKITVFGARTTPSTQIIMFLSTRFLICLKTHCNHHQDCFTMRNLIWYNGITCWSSLDHQHLQIDHVVMLHSNMKV